MISKLKYIDLQLQGVVRPSGGHAVALNWSMKHLYGIEPGEVRRILGKLIFVEFYVKFEFSCFLFS